MILIVIVLLEVVQLVLLWRMRKGGSFVSVTQKHVYVPAPPKKKQHRTQPRQRIEVDESEEEYYE